MLVLASNFFFSLQKACASSDMQFGQSILPVRFVYLDQEGDVGKIWSNVSQDDSQYVIKFFDEKKQEMPPSRYLVAQYFKAGQETIIDGRITKCTQLIEKDNYIEEVRTIV